MFKNMPRSHLVDITSSEGSQHSRVTTDQHRN